MARKTQIIMTDDIDGGEATGTVTFSLDGVAYEIDLSDDNAEKFRSELGEWASKARRVGGRKNTGAPRAAANNDTAKVREWAKANGYDVNDRGRISATIREAYDAAN